MKNNEIFLSWSLDSSQIKENKLRKLYHATVDFQIQNFEAIWSNCLSLIILYTSHEILIFFSLLFLFYLKCFRTTSQRVQCGLYIKKHLLLWAITITSTSSRCTYDKECFCYFVSFPLISSSNKIVCPRFPIWICMWSDNSFITFYSRKKLLLAAYWSISALLPGLRKIPILQICILL